MGKGKNGGRGPEKGAAEKWAGQGYRIPERGVAV